jgi:anthranilate/para-aminobenzoate synthase component II
MDEDFQPEDAIAGSTALVIAPGVVAPEMLRRGAALLEVAASRLPVLCVGAAQQFLAKLYSIKLQQSEQALAGRRDTMVNDQAGLFKGLPTPLEVARYDVKTIAEESLPGQFEITGHSYSGEILALRSAELRLELLVFHPHSVATVRGEDIIANFAAQLPRENEQ